MKLLRMIIVISQEDPNVLAFIISLKNRQNFILKLVGLSQIMMDTVNMMLILTIKMSLSSLKS